MLTESLAEDTAPACVAKGAAVDLLEDGHDIRTMQELLRHDDVRTTVIQTHVLDRAWAGVRSPMHPLDLATPPQRFAPRPSP